MSDTKQTNFAGGELSPLLYGRTDLPVWAKGLRTCENFLITKHGAAMSRPGTTFVNTTKFPNPTSTFNVSGAIIPNEHPGVVRLIPFMLSDDESFLLEFGFQYIRFHTKGATVLKPDGTPYEVVTPYVETELLQLKFAQVGEVLTICSQSSDPFELRHIADNPATWSFTAAVTKPIAAGFPIAIPALQAIDPVLDRQPGAGVNPFWQPDADHQAAEWVWKVTMLLKRTDTGETVETLPQTVVNSYDSATGSYTTSVHPLTTDITGNHIVLYSDRPVTVARFQPGPFAASAVAYTFVAMNIYRGRGTLFGLVGTTTTDTFVDVGALPSYDKQPPQGRDPFGDIDIPAVFVDSAGTPVPLHKQKPTCVCFFQQRRVFAGIGPAPSRPYPTNREQDLEISASGDFDNFDDHQLIDVPGEALQVTLVSRLRNNIRHLVSMRRMIILGSASDFHGGGTSQLPLGDMSGGAPATDFPVIEEVGASHVIPLVVDGACLFVRSLNRGARALVPAQNGYNYVGVDLTWVAEHLTRGLNRAVIDWTYAQDPWSVVWAVRQDGRLLSLTFDREQQMAAWAQHTFSTFDDAGNVTDPAYALSVCAVREGDEDAVYVVIMRTINGKQTRCIERMTSRHPRGGVQLGDSATSPYAAPKGVSVPPDYICLDSAIPYVGPAAQTFTGLDNLNGKQVYILAQGSAPEGPIMVVGGQVTAGAQYVENVTADDGTKKLVLYIGLPYECTMELLDVAGAEARARWKQVTHVGFEVDQSRGIQAGQDPTNLDDAPIRETDDNFDPAALKTEFIWFPVSGSWDQSARMTLKQTAPKPCTVVGVSRRLSVGG